MEVHSYVRNMNLNRKFEVGEGGGRGGDGRGSMWKHKILIFWKTKVIPNVLLPFGLFSR